MEITKTQMNEYLEGEELLTGKPPRATDKNRSNVLTNMLNLRERIFRMKWKAG